MDKEERSLRVHPQMAGVARKFPPLLSLPLHPGSLSKAHGL